MRAALADAGSTLEGISGPALGTLLVVVLVALLAFDYWRRDYERRRAAAMRRHPAGKHLCPQCGDPTTACNTFCEDCEAAVREPLTDDEVDHAWNMLRLHLERRRGGRS